MISSPVVDIKANMKETSKGKHKSKSEGKDRIELTTFGLLERSPKVAELGKFREFRNPSI